MEISTENHVHVDDNDHMGKPLPCTGDGYRTSVYPIPIVPLHIDDTQPVEGARQLLRIIRPHWKAEDIKFNIFTAGHTNRLIGCSLNKLSTDTVLVRIYGRGTDRMIDRAQERNSMVVLHTIGCAAPVYCRFDNGLAYGFFPGVGLDPDMVREPLIQRLIAREMVRMHSTDTTAIASRFGNSLHFDTRPSLFRTLDNWLEHVPQSYSDPVKQARLEELSISKEYLKQEIESLRDALISLNSPVVLCHNDLLPPNIVYNETLQKVNFIDMEYVAYNYQAFDIANHFCEYAGMKVVDFTLYPDRDYQLSWLRTFLEYSFELDGHPTTEITDVDVERLYVQVNKFSLACHLFWALWALIQARFSTIEYDYVKFACERLIEYRARKDEFLGLQLPS